MIEPLIIWPLIIIVTGALVAFLSRIPALHGRITPVQLSWIVALAPLTAFCIFLSFLPDLQAKATFSWQWAWLPTAGYHTGFYLDSLSALFCLLITLIGTLVVIYSGQYFKKDPSAWRFLTYIMLFMGAMVGLVMAGDVLTLFMFWEGTSILSFLLVAFKYQNDVARSGAFKGLLITGSGGIALLAGLLLVSHVAESTNLLDILDRGDILRGSALYPTMLGLVAIGAFTKSAQFPAHIWLPGAMSAPTPASAYLHSATMVKAGIYLLARLNPALGQTEMWFWLLTLVGLVTMLTGAYLGLKQKDLKAMLAYSTISQLGMLVMMIGQDIAIAFKALMVGILAHALYKSALFLIVGIVDHETGTRDLNRLGGLRSTMPYTFAIALVAGLSMAGLPPLFGFLAKETLLATAFHPSLPNLVGWIFTVGSIAGGALMFAMAGTLIWGTFMGKRRDAKIHSHEAPWAMLLAPAVPAILSLVLGQLPGPKEEAALMANAASAAHGATVKVSFALWTGLNAPLLFSCIAISLGLLLFIYRRQVVHLQHRLRGWFSLDMMYDGFLAGLDRCAHLATGLQQGRLRIYLVIILSGTIALVIGFGGIPITLTGLSLPLTEFRGEMKLLALFVLIVTAGTTLASALVRRDFTSILAFGTSGLGVAAMMALALAPDVARVQIVVDILAIVILILALNRLPRFQRRIAQSITFKQQPGNLVRDIIIAAASGLMVTLLTLSALVSRPRESMVTPFYEKSAKTLVGAESIVGAIIADFRGLDTLIEIAVFSVAGIGICLLLRFASHRFGDIGRSVEDLPVIKTTPLTTFGIGGTTPSVFIKLLAYVALPVAMVIGVTDIMYGHSGPGDGFTAGVTISLAIGFWYVVFGYEDTRRRLPWLRTSSFITAGFSLAIATGVVAVFFKNSFFSHVDFSKLFHLPLPDGFHLSTSFLFEVSICLCVVGSVTHMLDTLGHPEEKDSESECCLRNIREQQGEG